MEIDQVPLARAMVAKLAMAVFDQTLELWKMKKDDN
jgi:hypothetical protein